MDTQELKYDLYLLRRPLFSLFLIGVFVALVYFLSPNQEPVVQVHEAERVGDVIRRGAAVVPPITNATKAKLEKGPVFHALVSYTDFGFEPALSQIKKGETVRFTNNSSHKVWIAAEGGDVQIYPRTGEVCGSSDLDSCEPFAPQDFWQFRFDVAGEWKVVNNLEKNKGGVVRVE